MQITFYRFQTGFENLLRILSNEIRSFDLVTLKIVKKFH